MVEKDFKLKMSRPTIFKMLKNIGFKYKKTRDNRKLLTEKSDIASLRAKYLRSILKMRAEGRNIVYVDETYLHAGIYCKI